nr:hypothetical protein [Roseococcus microcysteis]
MGANVAVRQIVAVVDHVPHARVAREALAAMGDVALVHIHQRDLAHAVQALGGVAAMPAGELDGAREIQPLEVFQHRLLG